MPARASVLYNADIRTQDASGTVADALAWRDGRLIAVGRRADVEREAGPDASGWDAAGATVLPGFVDAHHHPCIVALYGSRLRLVSPRVTDIASLQHALGQASKTTPAGAWLIATEWDETHLAERRPPTRRELDDAVPDRPLFALHYSAHRAAANSRALELAGIDRHTRDPSGGVISRGADGVPDGLLIERGMSRVESLARASLIATDTDGFIARLGAHHQALLEHGITRVVDATVPADLLALYSEAARRGALRVPTVLMRVSTRGYLEAPWDILDEPVLADDSGGLLRAGPIKLVFDGAPACAMCLGWWQSAAVLVGALRLSARTRSLDPLRTSLSVEPRLGRSLRTGIAIYGRDEATSIVRAVTERGLGVATHAIGNDAVGTALSAYEAAGAALGRAGLPRIEHATFLDRELVLRLAGAGAAVVTQPSFIGLAQFGAAPSIPGIPGMPLRWLLDAGVKLAGSSDHPVVGFDPLDGIRAAVTRQTRAGRVYEPAQRIELDEALAMFTRTAAEVSGCLDECGSLERGKRADIVVLDAPLGSGLANARVRATILGGELVFGGF